MFRSLIRRVRLLALGPVAAFSIAAIPIIAVLPSQAQTLATTAPTCMTSDLDARIVQAVPADYPELARREGATGTTFVQVDLLATGDIADVSIAKSSGNSLLDDAALSAVRASRFAPAMHDCNEISGSYLVQVDWN